MVHERFGVERFAREPERYHRETREPREARDFDRPRRSFAPAPLAQDPFFDKPYEPAAPSADKPAWEQKNAAAMPVRGMSPNIRSKRKVGSLLGGGKV